MKIADLFVALGVKGADKSAKEVGMVGKAMKGTRDMSLEAKAAIVGAFYAAQQMFSKSGQEGTRLNQFSNLMDTTIDTLQRYQYAARQVGVTNEDVASTFSNIQKSMTGILMGQGVPTGFARISELIGLQEGDIQKFQQNPELLISKLMGAARGYKNTGQRNEDFRSLGLSDSMISALVSQAFRPEVLAKAPVYSNSEAKGLAKADAAWGNLNNSIEMAFGRFNGKYGTEIVAGFEKIIKALIELAEVAMKAGRDMKAFDLIRDGVKLTSEAIKNIAWFVKQLSDATKGEGDLAKLKPALDAIKSFIMGMLEIAGIISDSAIEKMANYGVTGQTGGGKWELPTATLGDSARVLSKQAGISTAPVDFISQIVKSVIQALPTSSLDKSMEVLMRSKTPSAPTGQAPKVEINNTMNFQHDGKESAQTSRDVSRETMNAFKTSYAQPWGN